MTNKLHLALSVVVGGLAIHGAITACGSVSPSALDARASDAPTIHDAPASVDSGFPSGTIVAFGGASPPSGWVICDGSTVSRAEHATLFAAIGINFGGGDGVNTFNLPDLRGRFVRGVDGGAGHDPDAASRGASGVGGPSGDVVGSLQADATSAPAVPFVTENTGNHTHANGQFDRLLRSTGINTTDGIDNSALEPDVTASSPMLSAGAHTHRIGGGFGTGGDKETRPANVAVQYIIRL